MLRSGHWLLGRWRGAPIRLHFSIVLGLLVFSRFRWSPGFFVAYPCLVLAHELGHAAMVRHTGHRLRAVEITALGGVCEWSGNASPFEGALIAWGGVLAQLVVYGVAALWVSARAPTSAFGWGMAGTFTHTNLWLIAINLLPIAPLDGARAWRIFHAIRERGPANLPHGSWREPSPSAGRAWFDRLQRAHDRPRKRARISKRFRNNEAAGSEPERDLEESLSIETRQALDRLLESVTGKARSTTRRSRRE